MDDRLLWPPPRRRAEPLLCPANPRVAGRRWLGDQPLPVEEQETVAAALRQVEFLDSEIAPSSA